MPRSPFGRRAARREADPRLPEREDPRVEIVEALHRYRWNRRQVAEVLGISRTTLWRKLKEYGLN